MDYDEHQRGQPQPGTALPAVKDTPAMRRVLLALLGAPGETHSAEVVKATGLERWEVYRAIEALVHAGWITERHENQAEAPGSRARRVRCIGLTEAARRRSRELLATITPAVVREAQGVSQRELARRLHLTPHAVWSYERSRDHDLIKLRRYFNTLGATRVTLRVVFDDDATLSDVATRAVSGVLHGYPPTGLGAVRRARGFATQAAVAERLGLSRKAAGDVESGPSGWVGTYRRYFEVLGGRLELTVEFADGATYTLTDLGSPLPEHRPTP
jgi:transcriptional regulator with XRE-family HTH domain